MTNGQRPRRPSATTSAVPPTFISSDDFTSSPTRKSRNMTPRSASTVSTALGDIQPSTCGSDEDAGQNLAHDAGLPEPLEELRQQLGGGEHHQHGERNLGGAEVTHLQSLCQVPE